MAMSPAARRVLRTSASAAAIALGALLALPGLDEIGEIMGFPASYHIGARILMGALWLVGVAAVWAYRPSRPGDQGSDADDGPTDQGSARGR
jgi:hypothetical protein